MITIFKIFETWNDDTIDNSLFISGRAKHNPKVIRNRIEYKTDNGKYVARIKQLGSGKFLCKVYRIKNDGSKIRIRKKIKDTLKTAHNFVREFLNDRLEGKKMKKSRKKDTSKKKNKEKDPLDSLFVDSAPDEDFSFDFDDEPKKRKTIIRRYK
jgi:hypothetical protein